MSDKKMEALATHQQGLHIAAQAPGLGYFPYGYCPHCREPGVWRHQSLIPLSQKIPQWLPIETAPKDGTYILLHTDYGIIEACWFHWGWSQKIICSSGKIEFEPDAEITHWMPVIDGPLQMPTDDARTGWPSGMIQDDSKELSQALANKADAKLNAREAAAFIKDSADTNETDHENQQDKNS